MSILGVKSIPLMKETNQAWKTVPGMFFAAREREAESIVDHIRSRNYEAVINLGRTDLRLEGVQTPIYNPPELVKAVSTPMALRRTLAVGDEEVRNLLPRNDRTVAHWHKGTGGFGGIGKRYCPGPCGDQGGEVQAHVRGPEFRVVSVGEAVVQASLKGERRTKENGRNDFEYEWVGVQGIRQDGIIPLVKEAVARIPNGDRALIGWDIIVSDDGPVILEANTSPGVNEATAARIVDEIRRQVQNA